MDSKKKRLWEARRRGPAPNFVMLTVESSRWRPESKGVSLAQELRRRARCLRLYDEYRAKAPNTAEAKVCREFGISARTLRQWRQRHRQAGLSGLIPAPRRPRNSPRQTPPWLERIIIAVRLCTGWGAQRIAQELTHLGLAAVTHNAVYGVLERRAMKVPLVRRSRKAGFRYQREVTNDLWHMDVKGPLYFGPGRGPWYGIAILDDRSRFCVGATLAPNRRMDTAIALLEAAVGKWGAPRQLMSDNGSEFVGVGASPSPSRFVVRLTQLGIEHLPIKLRTPETNGKIERFWLTLEQELLTRQPIASLSEGQEVFAGYVGEYNFNRRHWSLDYATPAQIYCPAQAGVPMPTELKALMPYLMSLKEASEHHR